jgi:hypothetical protein
MFALIGSSAFGAATLFGFRHGFDWDHLAALTDLTGSQPTPRRSMRLATLYAFGHGCMIMALGAAAILFGRFVPNSVSGVMERVIGATLIGLACWIVFTTVRNGGMPPIRSRWMLLIEAARRVRTRMAHAERPIVVEHDHPHDHGRPQHSHDHRQLLPATDEMADLSTGRVRTEVEHSHAHRHIALAARDPFLAYTGRSSFGIGVLHGIGAETPTQVLLFVSAANATGNAASIGLLVSFVAGLIVANTLIASASTFGFQKFLRYRLVTTALAAATAAFSLFVGFRLILGR